jgi:hypothetical protein
MIKSLKNIPDELYLERSENIIREYGGLSEYNIVQKRISVLRIMIRHYKTSSQIIPIKLIIKLNHLEQVGKDLCKIDERNKIKFEYSNN